MITAIFRKLRADIISNRVQFILIGAVLALSAMLLLISILILTSSQDPWDRTFEETNGPHLWIVSHQYDLDYSPLFNDPEVIEHGEVVYSLAENPIVMGDDKQDVFLYGMDEIPSVASPIVAEGRWLDPANPGEVVLDYSLARYFGFQVGDEITILAADGTSDLKIVGFAVTSHWFPFDEITKDVSPGVAYITQSTLEKIQPDTANWYSVVGLRISKPDESQEFGNHVLELFPGKLRTVLDWQYMKDNAILAGNLNGLFMGLFSILGLGAVAMIIFNTIGGQVLSQYRSIGLLKSIGFKPGQVTLIFLCEHLAIALLASLVGIGLGLAFAPYLVNTLSENLNTAPPDIYSSGPIVLVVALVLLTVGLTTLIPAWRGGRINSVQAITGGYRSQNRRASRLAKISAWLKLPPVVTMGVKDTFAMPMRSGMAIFSLFLTLLVAITAVGALTTARYLTNERTYFNGTSADMKVGRNFVPVAMIEQQILSNPEVVDYYQESFLYGQIPRRSDQPLAVRLLEGNYQNFEFLLNEGRMISAPGEAIMGYAVLELLGAEIGDTVEIQVEGNPLELTVVGRYMENFNLNKVIITSMETYREQVGADFQPQNFYLQLADPDQADALRREWLDQSQGLINVSVSTTEPAISMVRLVDLIVSLSVILTVVASANLFSTSLLSIQERVKDFGILKAIGFTPSQIVWMVVVGATTIVFFALVLGYTVGMQMMTWFVSQVGMQIGAGPDFYLIDWGGMAVLLPIFVAVALVSSLLPALRASKINVVDALRYE